MSVLTRIERLLTAAEVPYERLVHPPTFTADEAAAIRGAPVRIGGKSLVMKVGTEFSVVVVSGARKVRGRLICKHRRLSRIRFATQAELLARTGLEPGCVPPFGRPIFDMPLYVDASIAANDRIAFNPGDHGVSIVMAVPDYLRVAQPAEVFPFSVPRDDA